MRNYKFRQLMSVLLMFILMISMIGCNATKPEITEPSTIQTQAPTEEVTIPPTTEPVTEPPTEAPTEPPYVFDPENIQYPILYSDDTAVIEIQKEWYESAWVFAAHIEFTDYTRFGTECAYGSYNAGYETVSAAAERIGAILAVNGSYSIPKYKHCVVTHGIIQNGKNSSCWAPGIYNANTGKMFSIWDSPGGNRIGGVNLTELVTAGLVTDTFSYSPPIVTDGEITANDDGKERRVLIGTNGSPGDIWVVVTNGNMNDNESEGLTYTQCAEYMLEKGCTFVIPLEGGVNATLVYQGVILNAVKSEKQVFDFVYFKNFETTD